MSNKYVNDIIENLKLCKKFNFIDERLKNDLEELFDYVPEDVQKKLHTDIVIYSIYCPNDKTLKKFQIREKIIERFENAILLVKKININCLKNIYKYF